MGQILDRQRGDLFPWTPVALGVGTGIYFALSFEVSLLAFACLWGLVFALAGLVTITKAWRSPFALCVIALALGVSGLSLASWRAHSVASPVLDFRYYGPVQGRVVMMDRSASEKPRLTLDQVVLRMSPDRTPDRVRVSLHGEFPTQMPRPGDTIILTAHLGPPSGPVEPGGFDFQRHMWFKGLGGIGYSRTPVLRIADAAETGGGISLWLYSLRKQIAAGIKAPMGAREGPFAAAIVTGDRADIDAEALQDLRDSNLAHLLAISGMHMGMLTGAIYFLVRLGLALHPTFGFTRDIRKYAAVAAWVAATVYLGLSGATVPTQRAYVMASVMLFAILLSRPAFSIRAVALAALIVLIIRPESLAGPGFQMSFAATLALVAVFGVMRETDFSWRVPKLLRGASQLFIASAVAGAATAPIGAAHFNQFSQFGLIANLLSVPVMGSVVMPGAILAGVLAPLGLEAAGLWVMELGLKWILAVAHWVAHMDGAVKLVPMPGPWVLPLVSIGGLILCLWRGAGRLVGIVPLLAAMFLWDGAVRPVVLISETGRLVGLMTPEGRALNKPKGDGFSARSWLENDADLADQETAAARGIDDPNVFGFQLADAQFYFDARAPEKVDLDRLCAANIAVAPRLRSAPCPIRTEFDFRDNGSLAIHLSETGLEIVEARALQGARLWTGAKPIWP